MRKIIIAAVAALALSGCTISLGTQPTEPSSAPSAPSAPSAAPVPSAEPSVDTPQGWNGQTTESQDDQVVAIVSGLFEQNYGQTLPANMRAGILQNAKNYCTLRGQGHSSDAIFKLTEQQIEKIDLNANQKKILGTVIGWSYGAGYQVYCSEFPKDF